MAWMHTLPPEALAAAMLAAAFSATLIMLRLFGAMGLTVMIVIAVLGANIQVLKVVQFGLLPDPVALGTVLFATTYLATDILSEHYGEKAAHRAVWVAFMALLLHTTFMLITLGFRPLAPGEGGEPYASAAPNQNAMELLFLPQPALLLAGLTAFLISQHHDVWAFHWWKKRTAGRFLWLRNNASSIISGLIDNIVFSVLAWVVFAPTPMPWEPLVFTYILGTYLARMMVALLDTPILYLARRCLPPEDRQPEAPRPTAAGATAAKVT